MSERPYEHWTAEDLQLLLIDLERMADEAYASGNVQMQLAKVEAEIRQREFED